MKIQYLRSVFFFGLVFVSESEAGCEKMKGKEPVVIVTLFLLNLLGIEVKANWSQFYQLRGRLIFQEEFNTLNRSRWQHIITTWRGGNNEFEYYTDRPENRYFHQLHSIICN